MNNIILASLLLIQASAFAGGFSDSGPIANQIENGSRRSAMGREGIKPADLMKAKPSDSGSSLKPGGPDFFNLTTNTSNTKTGPTLPTTTAPNMCKTSTDLKNFEVDFVRNLSNTDAGCETYKQTAHSNPELTATCARARGDENPYTDIKYTNIETSLTFKKTGCSNTTLVSKYKVCWSSGCSLSIKNKLLPR